MRQGSLRLHAPARGRPHRRPDPARPPSRLRAGLVGRRARRGRAAPARRGRPRRRRALRLGDDRAGVRAREARAPGHRLARGDAAGGGHERARRVPPAALGDRRREGRRRARRRAARRERADRRPLGAQGAPERRDASSRPPTTSRTRERVVLIWSGPGGRGGATRRAARREARPRGRGRQRRVLRARDAERPRRRRRLGAPRPTTSRAEHGLDRPADRLGRRGGRQPERARARRARRGGDRDLDVPRPRRRLGRPRPAGHELPRARRHVRQPRGPAAAAAPHGDCRPRPTSSSGSRSSRRASTSQLPPYASAVFAEVLRALLRRACRSARSASAHRSAATRARRRTSTRRRCRSRRGGRAG